MEGVLLLATIAQKWRFRLVPGHSVEIRPLITLRTKYGMRMTAERRIPFSQDRPGARCWFRRSDLDRWREQTARGAR